MSTFNTTYGSAGWTLSNRTNPYLRPRLINQSHLAAFTNPHHSQAQPGKRRRDRRNHRPDIQASQQQPAAPYHMMSQRQRATGPCRALFLLLPFLLVSLGHGQCTRGELNGRNQAAVVVAAACARLAKRAPATTTDHRPSHHPRSLLLRTSRGGQGGRRAPPDEAAAGRGGQRRRPLA